MEYILAKKLKITKPMFFLCGPYYDKNNPEDRRNILQNTISKEYKKQGWQVLPLIVDLFFTEKNLDTKEYSVQLLEEVCASISAQTHIFLDTMSAATELGIFANSVYNNRIIVYIPKNSDVYNKGNVGYFVREAVLKNPNSNIETIEYRPKIIKKAFSSVFTAEHFAFNNNQIPAIIERAIEKEASGLTLSNNLEIVYKELPGFSSEPNCITYDVSEKKLSIRLSIKLLFYIVTSIIHQEIPEIVHNKIKSIDACQEDTIILATIDAVKNSVSFYLEKEKEDFDSINVVTVVNESIETVIKHIIKFNLLYYKDSQFQANRLLESSTYTAKRTRIGNHPKVVFPLTDEESCKVEKIKNNFDKCFEAVTIKTGKKVRKIVKYSDSNYGLEARSLHESLNAKFRLTYKPSSSSFAYHKGSSIKKCVLCHLHSKSFIKLDIKNFFGNISKRDILLKLAKRYEIDERYHNVLDRIISTCFYYDELPLGLVASPIISDFYLQNFDEKMANFCLKKDLTYTRYADDIMISSKRNIDKNNNRRIIETIEAYLAEDKLKLNENKTICVTFGENANFIRYIGINIIEGRNNGPNYLSVGKKYIYELAKVYIEYDKLKQSGKLIIDDNDKEKLSKRVFYLRAELIGKIDFIRQIEGERGIERLQIRLKKYYPQVDLKAL